MPTSGNEKQKTSIQRHVNTNENIVMLVEQLAHVQPPLKQVILEWNDKPWTKINSLTLNNFKAGEVDPEGKHLALAQMSPKPALPNKPIPKGQTAGPCSAAAPKLHLLMNYTLKLCSRKFVILGNSWPLHKCS